MKFKSQSDDPRNFETDAFNFDAAASDESTPVETELTAHTSGYQNGWRGHFPAAAKKDSKMNEEEIMDTKTYDRVLARFATTLALLACSLLLAATASAKIITVTGTGDSITVDGFVTLREAMTAANTNAASGDAPAGDPGVDTIKFNISGGAFHTITLASALPAMTTDPIIIDGTSQPGYAGTPVIELNGNNLSGSGLFIQAGGSTIKGLVINRFNGRGIVLSAGGGNTIVGNYIGTNLSGTAALGNTQEGILIQNSSSNNLIGASNGRNVISGNGAGITITDGTNNQVLSNFVGTNAAGTAALGNAGNGVSVYTNNNNIGSPSGGNVISANNRGVAVQSTASGNVVAGNLIGTNFDGTAVLGNNQEGVIVAGANNTIGGTGAGARNVISGNKTQGVRLTGNTATNNAIQGNLIGTNASGNSSLGNLSYGVVLFDCNSNLIGGTTVAARNLISGNGRGLTIGGSATGNNVQGNYIGVNAAGTAKLVNNGAGVEVTGPGNSIGGGVAGAGNLISGNAYEGISVTGTSGTLIKGNVIGTDATGTLALGNAGFGIRMINVTNTTIGGTTAAARNVISGNGGGGISIEGFQSSNNLVQGNFIGVDASGAAKLANNGSGVAVSGPNNTIGGSVAGAGNVISGNAYSGVAITDEVSMGNKIQGNLIGTNAAGTTALGNTSEGIRLIDAGSTLIGGTTIAARNVISANNRGITFEGESTGNIVQGNYIGTDITGSVGLGNNQEGLSIATHSNTIGGTVAGARNVISANSNGIRISGEQAFQNLVQGNYIGTKADGSSLLPNSFMGVIVSASKNTIGGTSHGASNTIVGNNYAGVAINSGVGNAILGNSIARSARLGIELEGDDALGLNENDLGDPDFAANWKQNYPLLTSVIASGGNTTIQGTLNSTPNKQFRIEFFSNTACDGSGFGEGETYFGSKMVTTDANGNATINASLPGNPAGQYVTATATSPGNDTSEFSPCALVGGPNPGVLQFANSFFLVEEATGMAKVMVTRTNGMTGPVTVQYSTSDGSATNPADYALTSGTLNFADGEVIKTFTIPIVPDNIAEAQETVALTLSGPTGGAVLGANSMATLYINSADPTKPGVIFSDASVIEGDSGPTNMVFTITMTPHTIPVTVGYTTASASATTPDDYQFTSGQIVFNPGEDSKQVMVPVFGDVSNEGDELFNLELVSLSAGYFIDAQGTGLIIDDDRPRFQFAGSTFSVNENGSTAQITVLRTGDISSAATVDYATSDGTAKAGQDYFAASGTLTFASGESNASFNLNIADDGNYEGDETVNLTLTNPSAGAQLINPTSAVLTIVDDEQPPIPVPGTISFTNANFTASENSGQGTVTVSRTGGANGVVSVEYSIANGGTATPNLDYIPVSGTLTWSDGDMANKTFAVAINDDSVNEANETINIGLSNVSGGAQIGLNLATFTIVDNDSQPSISINDVSQAEGNSGLTNFNFNVTLSAASAQTVTVNYAPVAGGTATLGNDYQLANGTLTFAPGETSKALVVSVIGETDVEADETFVVTLSNPQNATISKAQGTGTIINDDAAPTPTPSATPTPFPTPPQAQSTFEFAQSLYTVPEDLTAITVTVTRSGDTSAGASVDYSTNDGTALQKNDYEFAAGTLDFAPGETTRTITLLINEDSFVEGGETFTVTLSNPAGAALGQQSTTAVTITDDLPETVGSPLDDPQQFVYTHYHDFLNREPDPAGLAFWTNQITSCGSNVQCIEEKRINVSASFFLSIEFQETGYLRYLLEKESFGSLPKYAEFMRDVQELSSGVIVNSPGWEQKVKDNQQQFAQKWINRPAFKAAYDPMSNADYVNALYANAGILPTQAERDSLVNALETASQSRAAVLLDVAQHTAFRQKENTAAFVLMQYFGYLRRDPNAAPDTDLSGYNFWLTKLNQFGGNYIDAEMIKAFITSFEYRQRFAQ